MTQMNADLYKAILAMDSYNRGYGESIKLQIILNPTCPDRTQKKIYYIKT